LPEGGPGVGQTLRRPGAEQFRESKEVKVATVTANEISRKRKEKRGGPPNDNWKNRRKRGEKNGAESDIA